MLLWFKIHEIHDILTSFIETGNAYNMTKTPSGNKFHEKAPCLIEARKVFETKQMLAVNPLHLLCCHPKQMLKLGALSCYINITHLPGKHLYRCRSWKFKCVICRLSSYNTWMLHSSWELPSARLLFAFPFQERKSAEPGPAYCKILADWRSYYILLLKTCSIDWILIHQ